MFEIIAWIATGFLALFFLGAGLPKIVGKGIDRWVGFDQIPRGLTMAIGTSEVAAAIGLVVPLAVGVAEWTTPLAALGICVVSLMASGFHLRNQEWLAALETTLWAALAGAIAAARWGELASGPPIARDALVPVMVVLVPAIIIILIILARAPTRETRQGV